ncbi:MAG: FAD-dependent oxidoreductase [Clostridia bacterium]|nr:FAD-dependent oxidoreductase [Clostridia bacterium]
MKREKKQKLNYEYVVVGGGLAGLCAAISASRHGVKTALIHARPVLGGNASSEIRMHICGADDNGSKPNYAEGGIIHEIMLKNKSRNPYFSYAYWDEVLYETARQEENLTVYYNTVMTDCNISDNKIKSIICYQETTEYHFEFEADYFSDCTGNGSLGFFAGANYREGSEGIGEFNEPHAPKIPNKNRMGNTILFKAERRDEKVDFTPPPFAKKLTEEQLKLRTHSKIHSIDFSGKDNVEEYIKATTGSTSNVDYGYWWIELSGESDDFVGEYESIKDDLISYVWGVWDHIKNGGNHGADNYDLVWVGALPGMRESRRFEGDYVLTENDVLENRVFEDAVAYGGWPIDIHSKNGLLDFDKFPSEIIPVKGIYTIPWRCYYSNNIENLTFAGRDISTSKLAFASSRVMGTCAIGGQAVGSAISLCKKYNCSPREILKHIKELQQIILEDDGYIPEVINEDENDLARNSKITASSFVSGFEPQNIVNGISRKVDDENCWCSNGISNNGEWLNIELTKKQEISSVQITFDSSFGVPIKMTLSENRRNQQEKTLPKTIVKDFHILFFNNGKQVKRIDVDNNFLRLVRLKFDKIQCESIKIYFTNTHGCQNIRVFEVRVK